MKVQVRGKGRFKPTERVSDYLQKKLDRLDRLFHNSAEIAATVLCKDYDAYKAVEITIPTKHLILRAEERGETIYGAIDGAIDKLTSQITRHKDKLYKSVKQKTNVGKLYAQATDFDAKALETEILATNIVKNKELKLSPMSVDDAILQMEMLGHPFFIFENAETGEINVAYLRSDQNYGLIKIK